MKKYIKTYFLSILLISVSSLLFQPIFGNPDSKNAYHVRSIDSINNYYVIQVEKNDSIFLVLSIKSEFRNAPKLKIGNLYFLNLISICPFDLIQKEDLGGIKYDGIFIDFSEYKCVIHDLFICESIKGLYYIQKE